jgi:transposase
MADHPHAHQDITCREFVEGATDYLEGVLPEERLQLFEEHMILCEPCIHYLDQIRATVEALPHAVVDEPVSDATRETLATMFRQWQATR